MRNNILLKLFIYCCISSIFWFLYKSFNDLTYTSVMDVTRLLLQESENVSGSDQVKLKYILQWTSSQNVPFVYMGEGQRGFIDRNCSFTNCFVTSNKSYLSDYAKFDVIAFAGPEMRFIIIRQAFDLLPQYRSLNQKYVFATIESADNYPVCSESFNEYFNWTWTYRLDSDAKWGYIVIRDTKNNIVGPKTNMNWMKSEDMDPVSDDLKERLKNKTKAAAWFLSNCYSRSRREIYVRNLKIWLKKYNIKVDIYGECGNLNCPRDKEDECNKMIERDYYFYLSFENSFAEDYVTEKLLHPLQNYALPIVYGGANYTRFMPDGIYLDARKLGPAKLAKKMHELMKDPDMYADMFRWRNHYSYHRRDESIETNDYCRFCSMLNEDDLVRRTSVYKDFRRWWDPPNRC